MRRVFVSCVLLGLVAAEPDPAQKAAVDAITALVRSAEVVWNDAGRVQKLAISNHSGTPRGVAGNKDATGVTPAVFARIEELTDLEAIAIEHQPLGDVDYARLGKLTKLRDVRFQYVGGGKSGNTAASGAVATKDFALVVNQLPLPLTVLEIKHVFSVKGGCMERLKPQPELVKCELDTGHAGPDCVPFLLQSPKLVNLQLHRTTITDENLAQLVQGLPQLETLLLRPSGKDPRNVTGASLRHLTALPRLRHLSMGMEWRALPYAGALDALAAIPSLKQVEISPSDIKGFSIDDPAIQNLHAARPDMMLIIGGKTLGGTPDHQREQEDAAWNWDKGVNTHG